MLLDCCTQESHSKFSVTTQMGEEDLWSDPTNIGMRPQEATRPKTWKNSDEEQSKWHVIIPSLSVGF
jgi:hypothetical protein